MIKITKNLPIENFFKLEDIYKELLFYANDRHLESALREELNKIRDIIKSLPIN